MGRCVCVCVYMHMICVCVHALCRPKHFPCTHVPSLQFCDFTNSSHDACNVICQLETLNEDFESFGKESHYMHDLL